VGKGIVRWYNPAYWHKGFFRRGIAGALTGVGSGPFVPLGSQDTLPGCSVEPPRALLQTQR